jgi:CBS domain-containing protein
MSLARIVRRPAITCAPTTSVTDAARVMTEARVGLLVVVDGDARPVGVLTDRDIVVRWVAKGHGSESTAADLMSNRPACVNVSADAVDAARTMGNRQCRRVVVTDDVGRALGVVSADDLLTIAGDSLGHLARVARAAHPIHEVVP